MVAYLCLGARNLKCVARARNLTYSTVGRELGVGVAYAKAYGVINRGRKTGPTVTCRRGPYE
jgi:hypothetical protein